jgi:hypothetical protein
VFTNAFFDVPDNTRTNIFTSANAGATLDERFGFTNAQGQALLLWVATSGWFLNQSGRDLWVMANAIFLWDGTIGGGTKSSRFFVEQAGVVVPYGLSYTNNQSPANYEQISACVIVPAGGAIYTTNFQVNQFPLANLGIDDEVAVGGATLTQKTSFSCVVLN